MAEVTDPDLIAMLETSQGNINKTSSDGTPGVGHSESQTRESQFTSTPQLYKMARDLATAHLLNQRIPTGRWEAAQQMLQSKLPPGWKPSNIADFQKLGGVQQTLTKPIISLNSPAGTTISSKEFDTPAEQVMAKASIPGPDKERDANTFFINRTGRDVLDRNAFNAFSARWRANHNSVYAKAKNGQTMEQAWEAYTASPAYKQTVLTPYTQLLANGGSATPPRSPKKVAGGNLQQGADGVYVWHP